ncbi:glycosyl hydrolase family 53 [Saccharothrix carnea]|uniref:Arabinogalactan endo-beta-1,4-galactanase n=2 Tax=Saccharothrix carnea TaxID=1280637 RepID=A0A2P8IF28_SACCR|nr:glycosyl hydrolase family 53 [Saccharothrix carnea]
MNYSQMRDALRGYVDRSLNVMKSAGVTPGWVKIGNGQNSGICRPVGSVSNPAQMTGLLNAAYDVSKQVFEHRLGSGHPQADRRHGRLPQRLTHGEKRRPPARDR